jgi:HlyD family secretion protein
MSVGKRPLIAVLVLIVVVVVVAQWPIRRGSAVAPTYRTAVVERGDLVVAVSAAGTVNAVMLVEVGSQISGQIKEVLADFNSQVERGQLIARIDPDIFHAKVAAAQADLENATASVSNHRARVQRLVADLENARANAAAAVANVQRTRADVDSAHAAVASASAGVARESATVQKARRDLERRAELFRRQLIAQRDADDARTGVDTAHAQVDGAQAQERAASAGLRASQAQLLAVEAQARAATTTVIRAAEAAVDEARAQLTAAEAAARQKRAGLSQAQIDLRNTEIRAPVTGTVISRNVNVGQTVAASLQAPTLFTIAQDLKHMQVEATVVEADVTGFTAGQDVTFTVDAQPGRTFTGKVVQVRKAPQTKDNIVTYVVVVGVVGSADGLLPGMTANLQVVAGRRQNVLKVPNAALRFRPDGMSEGARSTTEDRDQVGIAGRVFVVGPNGQPTPVALRLGRTDGRVTELLRGDLREGQAVITGATLPVSAERRLFSFRLL